MTISTHAVFWEHDVIYSNSQPILGTRKINGAKFLEGALHIQDLFSGANFLVKWGQVQPWLFYFF